MVLMRIVHLTDLHLRCHLAGSSAVPERASRLMPDVLARAVTMCRAWCPDLGVISGDLVDVPFPEVEGDLRTEARKDLLLIQSILGEAPFPWIVVPGNHDLADQVMELFPPPPQVLGGYRLHAFVDHEREDHVPERTGSQRERQYAALLDGDCRPQIHVQHYVITPRLDAGYPHTYADGEFLGEQIVRSGRVALVLSGHYHDGVTPFRIGRTWFSIAPALCVRPFPAMLYELEGGALTWQRVTLEVLP